MSEVEDPGAAAIEKCTALPDREIVCGEFAALSVSVNMPFELPTALGLKVTLMLHEADAASDDPQLFVCAKLLLAPAFRAANLILCKAQRSVASICQRDTLRLARGAYEKRSKRQRRLIQGYEGLRRHLELTHC